MLEKAWQQGRSEGDLRPLIDRAACVQVHLSASYDVAAQRGLRRAVRPGLVDMVEVAAALNRGELEWESFGPLELEVPLLHLDADRDIDLDPVEIFVWAHTAK